MSDDDLTPEDWELSIRTALSVVGPLIGVAVTGNPLSGAMLSNLVLGFWNTHSEVKKTRAMTFLQKFMVDIEKIRKENGFQNLDEVEFMDLFELALSKSVKANTEEKIERFKQILIGQMLHPESFDYVVRYFEIAGKLADSQLIILKKYVSAEKDIIEIQKSLSRVIKEKEDAEKALIEHKIFHQGKESESLGATLKVRRVMEKGMEKLKSKELDFQNDYNTIRRERNEQFKILGEREFNFLLNDLRTMGLIYNPAEGRASDTGEYSGYRCTPLAVGFIKFLEE